MTGWERFSGARLGAAFTTPAVSITTSGQLYLNGPAAQLLDGAPRVELLWDAERRYIGLRPASETTPHSYALTAYQSGTARQVSASGFLTHYGLRDVRGKSLPVHREGDVLVVPLVSATDAGTAVES